MKKHESDLDTWYIEWILEEVIIVIIREYRVSFSRFSNVIQKLVI